MGILVAVLRAGIFHYEKEDVLFASFYGILGLIAGGKLLYLLTNISWIIRNFFAIISNAEYLTALMKGGFVFYGGFIGAMAGIFIYARQYKLLALNLMEIILPAVPLIHAFGRVGCFCAGCCYGIPIKEPWGLYFLNSQLAPHDLPLFPVQLLEAACNLVIFFIMVYRYRRRRTRGEALCFYLFTYGTLRFVLEFLRYDRERGFLLGLSTSQWISILLVLAALFLRKRIKREPQG